MASIAKLAVILSAVTKPLEDGLKSAQAKVSSFSSSFGKSISHGAGAMIGAIGMDKMEAAMKKALKSMPELGDAADRVEVAFGKTLISLMGMSSWLPTLASEMDKFASNLEEGFVGQELKEKALWLFEFTKRFDSEAADRRAQASRDEFINAKLKEKNAIRLAEIERKRFEEAREAQWIQMAGTEEQKDTLKGLEAQYKALTDADPAYKKSRLNLLRKDAPNSSAMGSIDHLIGEIAKLEEAKKAQDALNKLMEEGKGVTESMLSPMEKMASEQDKYNKMLAAGAISAETYNRAIKGITPGLKEVEAIQREIYKMEKGELAANLKDLAAAGASPEVLKQYEAEFKKLEKLKEMAELDKEMEKSGFSSYDKVREKQQFSGADEAGSRAAYSAIVSAQGSMRDSGLETSKRHVGVSQDILKQTQEMVRKQGDANKIWESHKARVITFGGTT